MIGEPRHFPPDWADAWGDDRFGLWSEFSVNEIRQRMRWVVPGEFWMGSPDSSDPNLPLEQERQANEGSRHLVRISRGFWLADTACTQALWMAIMGYNPSRFDYDRQCPVESISFDDVQLFLRRLAAASVRGVCDLPTEAEWEYACRAGTKTPFSFGAQIVPELVNYNGAHPYADGLVGLNRQRTVPVKTLPANCWGLYQMHGNVWEWCRDGLRKYTRGEVQNPEGPLRGGKRAARGGSWLGRARSTRSAARIDFIRGSRRDCIGFRILLRV